MKDFLPAFTFSFLMAQLFPGAVTVLCLTCPYLVLTSSPLPHAQSAFLRMMDLIAKVGDVWFGSTRNAVVFLFFAAATGMFLHGLDWLILGWETQKCDAKGKPLVDASGNSEYLGIREFTFHKLTIWKQLLLGPLNMVRELVRLFNAPEMKWITVEENVPDIDPASLPIFNWLQDFYLYFAQFYLHMAYTLLIGSVSMAFSFLIIGYTPLRLAFQISLYLLTSFFFLMGRTQLASLFMNEVNLVSSKTPKSPLQVVLRTNRL